MKNNTIIPRILLRGGDFLIRTYINRSFAVICIIFLVFTVSCGKQGAKNGRFLSGYPLHLRAEVNFDGKDYEIDVSMQENNDISITFSAPEVLKNTALKMKNGECFMQYMGVEVPITDGGYSADNGLLLIRHVFSLSANDYIKTDTVKESGVKYYVEQYKTNFGNVSVFFLSDATLPSRISATLNGHTLDLLIVNE